jgi:hypothetical protein
MNCFCTLFAAALLAATETFAWADPAPEELGIRPRVAETLTVLPRVVPASSLTADPIWLSRGALRDDGTYEAPLPYSPYQLNQRQLELLRGLDSLRLLDANDDPAVRRVIGPERILPPPREVKK